MADLENQFLKAGSKTTLFQLLCETREVKDDSKFFYFQFLAKKNLKKKKLSADSGLFKRQHILMICIVFNRFFVQLKWYFKL